MMSSADSVPRFFLQDTPTMEVSINSAVNAGLAVKDLQLAQEVQARLLKKVLNTQADTMATLLGSLPALATEGSLGTRVNTYA